MLVEDRLPLPARLIALIDEGYWPRTPAEAQKQNLRSLVSKDRIHQFAPEEDRIYFVTPPFHTVAYLASKNQFWSEYAALDQISPDFAIDLGDFGLGSDAPILLDYRKNLSSPAVIRLRWRSKALSNEWVHCANSFDEFAEMLGFQKQS